MRETQAVRARAAERDQLLQTVLDGLRADSRFVAAWLGGSLGRGVADAVSDLDLIVVVTEAASAILCARPEPRGYGATPARQELFARFGGVSFVYESHNNAPAGGTFSTVIYETAQVVDWTLLPRAMAERPPDTHLLFGIAGIRVQTPPAAVPAAERAALAVERIGFFWLMMSVAAKYIIREDSVYVNTLLDGQRRLLQEVRAITRGATEPYKGGSRGLCILTAQEQVTTARHLISDVLQLLPEIEALGASIPEPPLQALERLLTLAEGCV
ncbi:MAG TPA: nucleotidyltransferase domain-containing protein [Chloroflexota bacterium]|nr:nucleotidyltransferase domain-containing protein [Chloroflexota bacterium]